MANGPAKDDKPDVQHMEVGGTATAKVSFTDALGADVKIASVEWLATGPMTVTPDDKDPTTAKLTATGPGRSVVTAKATSDSGATADATGAVLVIRTGVPTTGKIEFTVDKPQAAPAQVAPKAASKQAAPTASAPTTPAA